MSKIAWIGLGVMGFPMAGHIRDKGGYDLTVYNRTAAKADEWVAKFGGRTAATPAEAARDADFVFSCVGNDDDLRAVTTGPGGAFEALKSGAVFIDNTTASADVARELYAAAESERRRLPGCAGVRRPGGRGERRADRHGRRRRRDLRQGRADHRALRKGSKLIGPAGSGQLTKMVNQICIAGLVQGLAEGIHFAQKSGLDVAAVIDAISKGAAQSWQMENRWKTMNDGKFDFGFAVDWMRKDLSICLDEARRNGAHLPVTALVDQFYSEVQKMGGKRWDTSSLIARLNRS